MSDFQEAPKKRGPKPKRDHKPDRPARVPLNGMSAFDLPPGLDTDNYTYRWGLDDKQGSIARYQAAWWEIVGDAPRIPSKDGNEHILLRLPMEIFEEDRKLQEARNIDTLVAQTTMEEGDYIPNDQKFVVQKDI